MIIFDSGITLTANENSCLLHLVPNAESWVSSKIANKARRRRDALIEEWRPRLYADDRVTELPADSDDLANLIMARDDYKTRVQKDEEMSAPTHADSMNNYNAVTRSGSTVTLFPSGINLADVTGNVILAYAQSIEGYVMGALMGGVNRGKKTMITQYHPIIMADPSVSTMPATEDGLITMILARPDYKKLGG